MDKKSFHLHILIYFSFFIFIFNIYPTTSVRLLYPISFGIVRFSSLNQNLSTYMNSIGYPKMNQNGHNIGYNIIAIDGYKTQTKLSNLDMDTTALGTWGNVYTRIVGSTRNIYGRSNDQIQKYIKKKFNQRGVKIIMNAFAMEHSVSQKNADPIIHAEQISKIILTHNFDGVSIQFDDFNSVHQKTASKWLLTLIKTLHKLLTKTHIISLSIPVTFIPQLQLFKSPLINSYIHIFIFKYFNLLNQNYSTFQTIFNRSTKYKMTSIWQIQLDNKIKIDTCKIVIAKPSNIQGTWTQGGFISANGLNDIFQQARVKYSWFGGYANMDMLMDVDSQFQENALRSIRQYCYKYQTCYCK